MVTKETIDQAISVINYAVKNEISIKKACVECGLSDTYVKNVKARIKKSYDDGDLDPDLYVQFSDAFNTYSNEEDNEFAKEELNKLVDKTTQLDGEQTKIEEQGDSMTIEWRGFDDEDNDGIEPEDDLREEYEEYKKREPHIKTLEDLLDACEVDSKLWKVKHHIVNKWDVTSWKSGFAERRQNFQVKAFLERKVDEFNGRSAAEIFHDLVKNYKPPVFPAEKPNFDPLSNPDEKNLLEICIFDLHIGKLAWAGETGENYDVKIGSERFMNALYKLLDRVRGYSYERILFPVGNDFFNTDNLHNTTTAGTPQDEDLRWQKTFSVGSKLLVDGINLLKKQGVPVDVVIVPGNHDFERSFYLGSFLEAWFRDDEQVTINNGPSPRKYYKFGKVLLGFTHGKYERESALPMLMASEKESKKIWADTDFHEWHLGHIHRKRQKDFKIKMGKDIVLDEELGVTIRYLSSLTGTEQWHHKRGYVGSLKAADGFIWNDEAGLMGHFVTNITENEYNREH
jgi:hypothetical protein